MKIVLTLDFSDKFWIACILFRVKPEDVLQQFVSGIALPSPYAEMDREQILATDFFIEHVNSKGPEREPYLEEQRAFLRKKERQRNVLLKNRLMCSKEEGEEAISIFYAIWLQEWREKFG